MKGFVTVSSSSIEIDNLPVSRKNGSLNIRFRLFVWHVWRLQNQTAVEVLVFTCCDLYSIWLMKGVKKVGCIGIVVYAKPDSVDFEHFTKLKWSSGN